jgi:hypothetical protein
MPVPDRPIDAAEIATEWGQWVHDFVFAPAGCRVTGGEVAAPSGDAWVTLPIDTASVDPGGYADLTNNRLEVPANGAGLYLIFARCASDDGASSDFAQFRILVNGAEIVRSPVREQEGATVVSEHLQADEELAVNDQITVQGRQIGSGTRADLSLTRLFIIRVGDELGAPTA